MTIESATYIDELNQANPEGTADRSESDNHHRLIKAVLLASFPNISGAMTASDTELNSLDGVTANVVSILAAANYAAIRALLDLEVGTDFNAYDATLASIASLGTVGDRILYTTGTDTWAENAITSLARTLIADASEAAMRSTLGLGSLAVQSQIDETDLDWSSLLGVAQTQMNNVEFSTTSNVMTTRVSVPLYIPVNASTFNYAAIQKGDGGTAVPDCRLTGPANGTTISGTTGSSYAIASGGTLTVSGSAGSWVMVNLQSARTGGSGTAYVQGVTGYFT